MNLAVWLILNIPNLKFTKRFTVIDASLAVKLETFWMLLIFYTYSYVTLTLEKFPLNLIVKLTLGWNVKLSGVSDRPKVLLFQL